MSAVGFVDNPTSCYSRLQTLTIEEYRARRPRSRTSSVSRTGRLTWLVPGPGPAEVRAWLDKRWQSGALLTAFAEGVPLAAAGHPAARPGRRGDRRAARGGPAVGGGVGPGRARPAARRVQEDRRPRGWRQPDSRAGPGSTATTSAWGLLGVRRPGAPVQLPWPHATAERCPRLVPWVTRRPVQTLRSGGWVGPAAGHCPVDRRAAVARDVPAAGRRAGRGHQVHRTPPGRARRAA